MQIGEADGNRRRTESAGIDALSDSLCERHGVFGRRFGCEKRELVPPEASGGVRFACRCRDRFGDLPESMVAGMVTLTGGKTSHAAVVARQLGIACIVGCHSLQIDLKRRCLTIGNQSYLEGEYLTVDADHGHIYPGQLEIEKHHPEDLLKRIDHWRATQTKKPVVA